MRNWPYAYGASHQKEPARGFITMLVSRCSPKVLGRNVRHASTLGGWQLMVNAASKG